MPQASIKEILNKFQVNDEDIKRVRTVAPLIKGRLPEFVDDFYNWLQTQPEFDVFFGSNPNRLERVKGLQLNHWSSFLAAEMDEQWFTSRKHVGAVHAHIELPNDVYFAAMSHSGKLMVDRVRMMDKELEEPNPTADSMIKMIFLDAYVVIDEIVRIQREKISSGAKALMEISTPVTPIWEGILLLPLLGVLDSVRAHDIMDKTLSKIAETRAKVFVMDISGVGAMDTAVANQLIKITKATQLMGCETIISGLSPSIARTLVELGVNVGEVRTTSTLRDSFELALRTLNIDPAKMTGQRT